MEILDDIRSLQEEGAPNVLKDIMLTFLQSLPERVEKIHLSIINQKATELAVGAHTLKSSSSSVGLARIAALCAGLEGMGLTIQTEYAPKFLEALIAEIKNLDSELRKLPELTDMPNLLVGFQAK